MNGKVYKLLASTLAEAVRTKDLDQAVRDAYVAFVTLDASKSFVKVSLVAPRRSDADDQWRDRIVRYKGKVIGTRTYLGVGDEYHEHVDVRAAADYPHVHPSAADVLALMRDEEIGSHLLLAEICDEDLTPRPVGGKTPT